MDAELRDGSLHFSARESRKKYGPRPDERGPARKELFIKKNLNLYTAAGPQAFDEFVVSKRHRELADPNLRGSGSSSAWCSAHNVSAAAGRMFEDPESLRFGSARHPWSLEQQSSGPVQVSQTFGGVPRLLVCTGSGLTEAFWTVD